MSFLRLNKLSKTFPDGTEAVKGIDLSIEEAEMIVLLGPSGCGKTTTLRMIAGLETPTGGRVEIRGGDVTRLRPSERDVGFVFQFYALYPHMSVGENMAFPLQSIGTPGHEIEKTVGEVAKRLGIEGLLQRYPKQLSGGDQQRVGLARAMVRRPCLYLMDEPLGTLDAHERLGMREFIRSQQLEMRITTIYVTHDQEEAMSLADRVIVMNQGEICQQGPPDKIYHDPASLFVADFVGSPGMNLIKGEVVAKEGKSFFTSGKTSVQLPAETRPGKTTLGIRPERVHVHPEGPVAGEVALDEYLGSFRTVHVDTDAGRILMRGSAGERMDVGSKIRLGFDPEHLRLFDTGTGRRI